MKNRYRLIAFLSVLMLTTMACSITRNTPTPIPQTGEDEQKTMMSETRQLDVFTKIDMEGGATVNLVQGSEHSIKIEGTRRVVDRLITEAKGGVLKISFRDRQLFDFWNETPTLTITFTTLSDFKLDGGADLRADDLELDDLNLTINGGASVKLNDLRVNTLNITLAGGADIRLTGNAQTQTVKVSGGGNYQAEDLKSTNVNVKIDGAANVVVWAVETLKLDLTGAYSVSYWGSPEITQSIAGIGEIKALGEK